MKKIYMTMVALLCGVAAMAQNEDGLYVEALKVNSGATSVTIPVNLKNSIPVAAIGFRVALPEGFKFTVKKGVLQNYVLGSRATGYGVDYQKTNDGSAGQLAVYAIYPFDESDGTIINVDAVIPEGTQDGEYTCRLYNISYSAPQVPADEVEDYEGLEGYNDGRSYTVSGDITKTETSFTLTIGEGTGINSINADDDNAPVYNVAGQRVSKAQKGVYIQNGKKVAVK